MKLLDVSKALAYLSLFCTILAYAENPVMNVQLPFYDGEIYQCMQNSYDTPSHNTLNTKNDLDFGMSVGTIVVAAADGIMYRAINPDGFGTYAKVDHGNGYWTIYGHLKGYISGDGERVFAGQPIAYSGNSGYVLPKPTASNPNNGPHLHFGVHNDTGVGKSQPMRVYGLDKSSNVLGYFSTGVSSGFVCGSGSAGRRYESRPIGKTFSDFSCKVLANNQGVLCWRNNPTTCEDGDDHVRYYKNSEGAFQTESGSGVWAWCLKDTGQSKNIVSYLVGGYGVGGVGPGVSIEATDPTIPNLPDFITVKTWLKTPWGVETYQYGLDESIDTLAQSKNIGEGMCNGDITGHFYLSKDYKEDSHSGNGAWRRLDSTTTNCNNLKSGDTHTETKNTVLREWITDPGIYNIVYCMDHPQDDHNNGGDYPEEHESNNCSTEAVFEVVEGVVNKPDTDLIVSGLGIKNKSFVYNNEMYGAWMNIRNTGAQMPTANIRSQYAIKGPSTNNQWQQIADDGSEASNFPQNRDQFEEMISLIQAPSVPGWYALRGCADYQNAVNETNEGNNCTEVSFEVRQAYPDFVVSGLWLREGSDIKKGTRVHPYCQVKNIGNGAPPRSILLAYYINTGVFRDNDTVEASEIGPGQMKTENVNNDNIKLGDKGNRTYTCCVDYQGQVSESNEGNNCATINFRVR